MKLQNIHKLSKASQLSLLAIFILVGAIFFTVNNALQEQSSAGHAWYTSQSAKTVCTDSGASIKVSFTNTETSNYYAMKVVAQDVTTGQSVNLGTIYAQQTKTDVIDSNKPSLPNGGVVFKLSWADGRWGTDQRTADYTSITCTQPAGLAVVAPACITPEYSGSGVRILWSETKVSYIDISPDSDFSTIYNRNVSGTTSTTAPSGFALYNGNTPLTLTPGTKYYVRTWDGTYHSPALSFSSPACQQPTPTPTCAPPPGCFQNGAMICMMPYGGWCGYPTPTPKPTEMPTSTPTVVPQPTDTPVPGGTVLNFTVGLHGIGTGGDSANPNSQGNDNPLRPDRTLTVNIYDVQNQLVVTKQGTIHYASSSGKFNGSIDLGNNFTTGLYTIKVKTDQYLRAVVPGIQTISAGQTTTLPEVTLIAGDINGDNAINIIDYNILIGCYSDLLPATNCNSTNNVLADLNDDGHVNEYDYNLFLRELTNIGGQ